MRARVCVCLCVCILSVSFVQKHISTAATQWWEKQRAIKRSSPSIVYHDVYNSPKLETSISLSWSMYIVLKTHTPKQHKLCICVIILSMITYWWRCSHAIRWLLDATFSAIIIPVGDVVVVLFFVYRMHLCSMPYHASPFDIPQHAIQ